MWAVASPASFAIGNVRERHLSSGTTLWGSAKGDECPYAHDRSKVMVCRSFLQGHCAAGEACLLSHDTSSTDKMPVCSAFLRGSCTDPDCAYRHVKVPPSCLPGVLSLLRLYVFPALLWTPAH